MKWDDLKDSSEFAEAVTLIASLIAAVLALKKAEQDDENHDSKTNAPKDALQVDNLELKPGIPEAQIEVDKNLLVKPFGKMGYMLIGLGAIVLIQLAVILFIVLRLM